MSQNPFERWNLDPLAGVEAITTRLRELAEDADNDSLRAEIREAWEELTMHPRRRLSAALTAHPDTRPRVGRPPRKRLRGVPPPLHLDDLVAWPSVEAALGLSPADTLAQPDAALEHDPVVGRPRQTGER